MGDALAVLRGDRGYAVAEVALLGIVLMMISSVVVMRAATSSNSTSYDRGWEEALLVAETGVETGLYELSLDGSYATVAAGTALATRDEVIAAAESLAEADPHSVISAPGGDFIVIKAPSDANIYGVGFTPSYGAATPEIRVVRVSLEMAAGGSGGGFAFNGAVLANGHAIVRDTAITITNPATSHTASIHTNGDFEGEGYGSVDGSVHASGTVDLSATFDVWDPAYPEGVPGADPIPFLTTDELNEWEAQLVAEAKAGGMLPRIALGGSETRVINAPVYVNGPIELDEDSVLTIVGDGPVYVKGLVEMKGNSTLINSGMLAVRGTFEMKFNSTYEAAGDMTDVALVSFHPAVNAIEVKGSATANAQGVVYAAKGGVEVKGGATFYGALVGGGSHGFGVVELKEGAVVSYPDGLLESVTFLPTNGAIETGVWAEL